MGIQLNTGFSLKSKAFLDERDSFESLSAMKNYSETNLPDGIITYNKENGLYYVYNSANDIDVNLGRWREYNNGGSTDYNSLNNKPSINGVELGGDKTLEELGITDYDDTAIKQSISDIANGLMDSVGYSADYKTIDIITKSGDKKSVDVLPVISHAKITELSDVDNTEQANGKALVYNSETEKHEYKEVASTDELVKLNASSDAKYLEDLIDKTTMQVSADGKVVVKNLDGLETSITELNYVKGLTMPVQDVINMYANGGLKTHETPFNTYSELEAYDTTSFLDGINYLCTVLVDETKDNHKTNYLLKKEGTPVFYGYADNQRDFSTNPINLASEVIGKLGTTNIDTDSLFALLVLSEVYKTLTTNNEIFSTHGAKALYDELVASIGNKANTSDLQSHTNDTTIHITSAERTAWNNKLSAVILPSTVPTNKSVGTIWLV